MKIANAHLQMASAHRYLQQHEVSESLHMWAGQRPSNRPETSTPPVHRNQETVHLSNDGQAAARAQSEEETHRYDPKLSLIRDMLEFLTGRKIKLFDAEAFIARQNQDAAAPAAPAETSPAAGYGIEYDYHESYLEVEQTEFSASGTVTTSDGRHIDFSLKLSLSYRYEEESTLRLRLGDARKTTDPLVLNFAGTAAELTDQRFAFDLNRDGQDEQINFVGQGSGFLSFDRNGDGKINDGSELFGPGSGDGFLELSALDTDQNGWLDENDPGFAKLSVWQKSATGIDSLQSLANLGVGAISLTPVATPFSIKNDANELLGQLRTSGVFLQEDGEAGTIQQIDLTA